MASCNSLVYSFVFLVFPFIFAVNAIEYSGIPSKSNLVPNPKYTLYRNEEAILDTIEKEKDRYPQLADMILQHYKTCFYSNDTKLPEGIRRPFIVLEGNNFKYRHKITKILADTMGAKYLHLPPKCMYNLLEDVKSTRLRAPYNALSLYAASFNIRQLIAEGKPVIMNGFWYEQAAFVLGKLFRTPKELPPKGSQIYDPPLDLLVPDMVIFVSHLVSNERTLFTTRYPKYTPKITRIYQRFRTPVVDIVESSRSVDNTIIHIHKDMRIWIGDRFDLSQAFPYYLDHTLKPGRINHNFTGLMYNDLQSILNILEKEKEVQPDIIEEMMSAYQNCFFAPDISELPFRRKPFIVVEGNIRSNKGLLARMLSRRLGARFLRSPPKCLMNFVSHFDKGTISRQAFYALCLYVSAYNVRQLLSIGTAVVMNGYWTEQAAFSINKNSLVNDEIPPVGSLVYNYPEGLMKPDMLFYLDSTFSIHSTISMINVPKWELNFSRINTIYERFEDPKTIFVNSGDGPERTVDAIYGHIQSALSEDYDLSKNRPKTIGNI